MTPAALPVAVLPLAAVLVGAIRTRNALHRLDEARQRSRQFLDLLKRYWQSRGSNREAFLELVFHSPRLQTDLGPLGIAAVFQPIGARYVMKNYQVIVNELQELKHWIDKDDLFNIVRPGQRAAENIQEAIVRYLGVIESWETTYRRTLRNPLALLAEGMRWLVLLPLEFVASIGLLDYAVLAKARGGAFARLLSGAFSLLSVLSSIVTITLGWSPFRALIRRWLGL
jgi:hypothetical protein